MFEKLTQTSFSMLLASAFAISSITPAAGDNWPAWRGPRGDGISLETNAPLKWSATENIAWRTEIPGNGRSSPIVFGDRVFVTTGVNEDESRRVLCLDKSSGKIIWNTVVHNGPGGQMHRDNTMASSTPATDGETVFAVFVDDQGMKVVALDFDGKIIWSRSPGTYFSNHGFAASPVIYQDGVIINGHQDGTAFVVMLNRKTGEEIWRYAPAINQRSFSTPVLTSFEGHDQLILTGSQQTIGLDPQTGKVIWSAAGPSEKFVCTPSVGHNMVFSFGGSPVKKSLAVKLGGKGDVSATHVAWRGEKAMPYVPSPLLLGDFLHIINDAGIYTCVEPVSGKVLHSARATGPIYSSPIAVADRIYMFEDSGRCTILENQPSFKVIARNELGEETCTTPAVSGGQLFVRTTSALVCIAESE